LIAGEGGGKFEIRNQKSEGLAALRADGADFLIQFSGSNPSNF
jgi:hypothetical protein